MIKFRQKCYSEIDSSSTDESQKYEGGVLAPTLVAGGIGSVVYGKKKLNKAKDLKNKLPELIKSAKNENAKGIKEVNRLRDSWLGLGKYVRRDKIRSTQNATEQAVEREMKKVRKTARSARWNRMKGKGLISAGLGAAALGAYKLNKRVKRNKED